MRRVEPPDVRRRAGRGVRGRTARWSKGFASFPTEKLALAILGLAPFLAGPANQDARNFFSRKLMREAATPGGFMQNGPTCDEATAIAEDFGALSSWAWRRYIFLDGAGISFWIISIATFASTVFLATFVA